MKEEEGAYDKDDHSEYCVYKHKAGEHASQERLHICPLLVCLNGYLFIISPIGMMKDDEQVPLFSCNDFCATGCLTAR